MRRRFVVALALVLLAAACGGNDNKAASSSSSPQPRSSSSAASASSGDGATAGNADWAAWGHDGLRGGVTNDGPAGQGVQQVWTSETVDGDVYAQPLVVGGSVIVATENNSVYAFDVRTGKRQWATTGLGTPIAGRALPCGNVDPVGITGTPVADPANNRLYVVGMMAPAHHELFALALDSGRVLFHRAVDASGSDPLAQNQRGALALAGGKVYVPFGGRFGDCGNYKGRIVGVPADGMGDSIEYSVRANREGGFWTPPGPVVAADGSLLVASGNSDGQTDFDDGNAVIRLTPSLSVVDEWAPANWAQLNSADGDVGTVSPAVLTGDLVFQGAKSGMGYILDAAKLGGVGGELHQEKICNRIFGGVAHDGATVYVPCNDGVHSIDVAKTVFSTNWTASVSNPGPPIVAAGVLWVVDVQAGTVHAFNADNGQEVFKADVGTVTHFTAPASGDGTVVVAGGRKVVAFASGAAGGIQP